uniref:Uncharacterized protein n=1 Tax=Glossina austeni TaxID=7395 RepID=A0A1A9VA92_GLOAU
MFKAIIDNTVYDILFICIAEDEHLDTLKSTSMELPPILVLCIDALTFVFVSSLMLQCAQYMWHVAKKRFIRKKDAHSYLKCFTKCTTFYKNYIFVIVKHREWSEPNLV